MTSGTGIINSAPAAMRPLRVSVRVRRLAGSLPCVALAIAFAVMVFGVATVLLGAGRACGGFPLCNGEIRPMGETALLTARLHSNWSHRVFAFVLEVVVLFGASKVWVNPLSSTRVRRLSAVTALAFAAEFVVGAVLVSSEFGAALRVLHGVVGIFAIGSLALWAKADARFRSAFPAP